MRRAVHGSGSRRQGRQWHKAGGGARLNYFDGELIQIGRRFIDGFLHHCFKICRGRAAAGSVRMQTQTDDTFIDAQQIDAGLPA